MEITTLRFVFGSLATSIKKYEVQVEVLGLLPATSRLICESRMMSPETLIKTWCVDTSFTHRLAELAGHYFCTSDIRE